MKKVILRDHRPISPFMEAARDLRILNKPLWLYQRDVLARHCAGEHVADSVDQIPREPEALLVYRDSIFFNGALVDEFVRRAQAAGKPCQVAFSPDDAAVQHHMINLQDGLKLQDGL
ncbi:MAG TPA: multidrug transporter, partial [Chloroflexia bacterium]|nr:multidrug transporter [Chloroflexia bacterium]